MNRALKYLWFMLIVRPVVTLVLGLNVRRPTLLPKKGPAIVVANHNSHLDTIVLMTLFPIRLLPKLRPVAAADYFLRNRLLAWFALQIMGIIPLRRERRSAHDHLLDPCLEALDRDEILILFPEGTRGEPERLSTFKSGVAHLAKCRPEIPVIPVLLHGLGKALPKGEGLLVPCFCDVVVGEELRWTGSKASFMAAIETHFEELLCDLNSIQHGAAEEAEITERQS